MGGWSGTIGCVRDCAIFRNNFNLICPVQSRSQKYSASPLPQITSRNPTIPFRKRGVGHRHGRWDGMRWTRQRRARLRLQGGSPVSDRSARRRPMMLRTAKPCGPGTRCWCQAGGGFSNPTGFRSTANPPATVTRRIRRRGELVISRKAIAQGMPDCSACTCMLVCVFYVQFAHEIAGAACTRCSLRPLFGRNDTA